jgi:hypothetical protein
MDDSGLLVVGGIGASAALVARVRSRRAPARPRTRIEPAEVGLCEFPELGAFVQYSAPASAACRISLNRLAAAVAPHHRNAVVIELQGQPPGERSLPTVLYVDRSGAIVQRWARPPERSELAQLLPA